MSSGNNSEGVVVDSWETAGEDIGKGLDEAREKLAAEQRRAAEKLAKQTAELAVAEATAKEQAAGLPFGGRQVKIMRRPESEARLAEAAKEAAAREAREKEALPLEERERRYAEARLRIFGTLQEGDPNPQGDEGASPASLARPDRPSANGAPPSQPPSAAGSKKKKKGKKGAGGGGSNGRGEVSPTEERRPSPEAQGPSAPKESTSAGRVSPSTTTRVSGGGLRKARPPSPDLPADFVRSAPMAGVPTFQGKPLVRPPYVPPPKAVLMPKVDLTKSLPAAAAANRGSAGFGAKNQGGPRMPPPAPLIPNLRASQRPAAPAGPVPSAFTGDAGYGAYGCPPPAVLFPQAPAPAQPFYSPAQAAVRAQLYAAQSQSSAYAAQSQAPAQAPYHPATGNQHFY